MKKTLLLIASLLVGSNFVVNAQQNRTIGGPPESLTGGGAAGSLNFQNNGDYVSLGNTTTLNLKNTFTIEAWVKPSQSLAPYSRIIENNFQTGYYFGTGAGGMNLTCILNNTFIESSTDLQIGVWQHVAVTFNNTTDEVKMYIDENLVHTATYSGTIPGSSDHVKLGIDWSLVQGWDWVGEMDEMRIWTSARSATQLADNNNCELLGTETGLTAYYKFNHGSMFSDNTGVTTLVDYAGTPQNGTLIGFALTGAISNWAPQSTSVNAIPSVIVTSDVATVCDGSNAILTASGADTYVWDLDASTLSTLVVTPNAGPTTYSVTGSSLLGCSKTSSITIGWNPTPIVSVVATPTVVCIGGAPTTMTASGALTYSWSHGETGAVAAVAPTTSTSYTVTGTDANGCTGEASVNINAITCFGDIAEALDFDGINDKVIGNNSLLPQGSAARTFTAWIKPSRVTGNPQTIFHYGSQATGASSGLLISGGNLYYVGENNDFNGGVATAITPNVWTHIALTLTGKTVKFYVNGVLKTTGTLATTPTTTGTNWAISNTAWSSPAREPFQGTIDEVTVWNRVISSTEISTAMRRETSPSGQVGLIGLYHFNQGFAGGSNGSTTSLTDASTSLSNGTLVSFGLTGTTSNWVAPGRGGKTKLVDVYCGTTLTSLGSTTQLACYTILNANNYQWEFTDLSNNAVFTFVRGNNSTNFYFYMLPRLTYGKTYSVRVKGYVNGAWEAYGESCTFSTPASFPTTQLLNVCGTTIDPINTQLACNTAPGATNYIWEFTNTATSQVYTVNRGNSMNNFYLYMLPSAPAGNYDVVIRAVFGTVIGPVGSTCNISFLVNSGRYASPDQLVNEEEKFSVNLFPNPSNGQFEITTTNIENLEVEIYDALGKVILKQSITSTKQSFDLIDKDNGIYFVKVSQNGKLVYTNRIIKQ